MGDPLKKVLPGHELSIPAQAYNAFIDAALAHRGVRSQSMRWNYGNVGLYAFGTFVIVGSPIQSGDKLSLRIEHLSDDQYRVCYHQNSQRIHEASGSWTFASTERHGVTCTPGGAQLPAIIGEWDNYSCHIGNP